MHEFELQPIGIGEEQRVVAFAVLRIVGRRIENGGSHAAVLMADRPAAGLSA